MACAVRLKATLRFMTQEASQSSDSNLGNRIARFKLKPELLLFFYCTLNRKPYCSVLGKSGVPACQTSLVSDRGWFQIPPQGEWVSGRNRSTLKQAHGPASRIGHQGRWLKDCARTCRRRDLQSKVENARLYQTCFSTRTLTLERISPALQKPGGSHSGPPSHTPAIEQGERFGGWPERGRHP